MQKLSDIFIARKVHPTVEMEQSIMSATDSDLRPINPDKLLKMVKDFADYKPNAKDLQEEIVRIIGLLLIHYSVPEKDFLGLLKKVASEDHKKALSTVYSL